MGGNLILNQIHMALMLAVTAFVTVTSLVLGLSRMLSRRSLMRRRLDQTEVWTGQMTPTLTSGQGDSTGEQQSPLIQIRDTWVQAVGRMQKGARGRKLRLQLQRAGLALTAEEYTAFLVAALLGSGLAVYVLLQSIQTAAVAAAIVWLGARTQLQRKARLRAKAFDGQLAEALNMLSNSLKAGYSFFQAMDVVSKEMDAPLADEFRSVIRETSVGMDVGDALQGMAQRINSEDLDLVITAVLIQRQVGGNLSEILERIGGTIRERVRLRGEVKTLTAQGRISGLIISLLPLAVGAFVMTVNPEYVTLLFRDPIGRLMLGMAVIGQIIGAVLIRKVVQIDI